MLFLYDFSVLNPYLSYVKVIVSSQITKNEMPAENRLTYIYYIQTTQKTNKKCVRFQWHTWGFDQVEFKESDCDNNWQSEIVIWSPKPEILIFLELDK